MHQASSGCKQATIKYFQMSFRDGYSTSSCDCMECDALDYNFPFVTRTHQLIDSNTCLDTTLKSDLMFLKWFLALSKHEQKLRLCPDILYLTYETVKGIVICAYNAKYIRINSSASIC